MIPKEAIEKAISTGWNGAVEDASGEWSLIALDGGFWKHLGKALGWDKARYAGGTGDYPFSRAYYWQWQAYAHRFFHTVLTGGNTDAFWEELLSR